MLSIGRVIGESAALIMVVGLTSESSIQASWELGGTTLATEIYRLTQQEVIEWGQVAAIGIVILVIILMLSLWSTQIADKNWSQTTIMGVSILLLLVGIGISNMYMFGVFIAIAFASPIFESTYRSLNKKQYSWRSSKKTKNVAIALEAIN
jgi:ABC-type Fe3+ transport system permease subunit